MIAMVSTLNEARHYRLLCTHLAQHVLYSMYWILCWPYKIVVRDTLMSSVESVTSHASRVFVVSLYCIASRLHINGIILCTLHAECGAISQIVCRWNQTRWVSQETVVSSSTSGARTDENRDILSAKKKQANMFAKNNRGHDPHFDSWGCLCACQDLCSL